MKLNELRDNPGATQARMRVGRGIGSGKGKTGRPRRARARRRAPASPSTASKAARCRSTGACRSAASTTSSRKDFDEVSLDRIQAGDRRRQARRQGDIDAEALIKAGVIRRAKDGVRLLGDGELKAKLTFDVAGASKAAIEAVEKAGGRSSCRKGGRRVGLRKRPPDGGRLQLVAKPISWLPTRRPHGPLRDLAEQSMASAAEQLAANLNFAAFAKAEELQEAHLVHAGRAARLPARHLHPAARHRSRRLRRRPSSSSAAACSACSTCSPAAPSSAWRSSRSASCPTSRPRSSCS